MLIQKLYGKGKLTVLDMGECSIRRAIESWRTDNYDEGIIVELLGSNNFLLFLSHQEAQDLFKKLQPICEREKSVIGIATMPQEDVCEICNGDGWIFGFTNDVDWKKGKIDCPKCTGGRD